MQLVGAFVAGLVCGTAWGLFWRFVGTCLRERRGESIPITRERRQMWTRGR